jgi:ankyrin repeat protein
MEALATENGTIIGFFAQQVIEQGIDPKSIQDDRGNSPIHFLAGSQNNYAQAISLFAKKGYGVNEINRNGEPPLFDAVRQGSAANVQALLEAGANIYYQNEKNGQTVLHIAAQRGDAELVKILLERGAPKDATAKGDITPAHIAAQNNRVSTLVLLRQHGADLRCVDATGNNLLHTAAFNKNFAAINWLVSHGGLNTIDVLNAPNQFQESPLHAAVASGEPKITYLLLNAGAQTNIADVNGNSPLHIAAGHELESERLRQAVPTISVFRVRERTASGETIALLAAHQAEVEQRNHKGGNPLFYAVTSNNISAVAALLNCGASAQAFIPDELGRRTIVEYAKKPILGKPNLQTVALLEENVLAKGGKFRAPILPEKLGGGMPPAGKPNMKRDDRTM